MDGPVKKRGARGGKLSKLKNKLPIIVYLLIVIVILSFLSLLIGTTKISASKVFVSTLMPGASNTSSIIWQVRMPRLVLAALSGALLAMAGAMIFGTYGAVIIDNLVVRTFYLIAAVTSAVSVFMLVFGYNLNFLYPWLLGSLAGTTWSNVLLVSIFVLIGLVVYVFYYKDLNALLFGEYTAKTLGVEVKRVRFFLLCVALLLSAVAVYSCGILSIAALILVYFVRFMTGMNHKYLIPVSIMMSASVVILLDIFSRIVFPAEIPIGIMMVVLCGPLYIYAMQRRRVGL